MANIENLKAFDPFADAAKGDDEAVQDGLVHVRYEELTHKQMFCHNMIRLDKIRVVMGINNNN